MLTHSVVRPTTAADLGGINDLYNFWIRTSHANFYTDELTMADREAWFAALGGRYRSVVAIAGDDVVGVAYSGQFRARQAYDTSVETTVYVAVGHGGLGIGAALYRGLFDEMRREDIHRLYAGIALPNDASVALHVAFGFRQAAHFTEQGRKFDRYWDVAWYERSWPDSE